MSEVETARPTMSACAIDGYGGPEGMQIRRLPVPGPGSDDVLIGMSGAEVGDLAILLREGEWLRGQPFPLVLGLAGAVAALGGKVVVYAEGLRKHLQLSAL